MVGAPATPQGSMDYEGLRQRVRRFRRWTATAATLRTLVRATTGAVAVVVLVETTTLLLRLLAPDVAVVILKWVPSEKHAILAIGLWAFVACGAVLLAIFGGQEWARRRPLSSVAGDIDRRLGLQERVSTAIEIGETRPAVEAMAGRLHSAQLKDTIATVADLDFRRARPKLLPRGSWIVAPLALLAVVIALGFDRQPELPVSVQSTSLKLPNDELTADERESTAQLLTKIATLLRETPGDSRAAFTEALARTAESVSNDLKVEPVKRSDLTRRLESLAKAVDSAFSSGSSGTHDRVADALQRQLADLKNGSADAGQEPASTGQTPRSSSDTPAGGNAPVGKAATPPRTDQSAKVAMPATEDRRPPSGDYYQADPELLARQQQEAAQMKPLPGATPAGAAQNASKGGNQAGQGVKAIAGPPSEEDVSRAAQRRADAVVLPQQDAGLGQRIRISVVPPITGAAMIAAGSGPNNSWHAGREAPVYRSSLAPGQLPLLLNYYATSDVGG